MTPYERGEMSARSGEGIDDNPYPEGSPQHAEWEAGFRSAGGGLDNDDEDNEEGKGI